MIRFFFNLAPNPMKVALMLEETELKYEVVPIDTRKGEQHAPDFLKINPNGKVPAIVDGNTTVFDSNAILLYLAEKSGKFAPSGADLGPGLSWLMFIASGIGPFSGQAVHFKHFAPEPKEYALNRYEFEAERHWNLIEKRLGQSKYMAGNSYTIVDMSLWGWMRALSFVFGETGWAKFPNAKRLFDEINARPAAQRADAMKTKYTFKAENDDEAKKNLFPQNARLQKK